MSGILVGTAILWILNAALVAPLAARSLTRRLASEGLSVESLDDLPEEEKNRWKRVATNCFIQWDLLVLGVAGLIGGLLGYYFIGISFESKGWPGMLAFSASNRHVVSHSPGDTGRGMDQ